MTERVRYWKEAWESLDLERIVGLYAADATHTSRLVVRLCPEIGSETLHGEAEIREYVTRGLVWFVKVDLQIGAVLESENRSAIEYRRCSNVDGVQAHVVELIEWRGRLIRSAVVFQF